MALESVVDPETGRLKVYRSPSEKLAKLMGEVAEMEADAWDGMGADRHLRIGYCWVYMADTHCIKTNKNRKIYELAYVDNNSQTICICGCISSKRIVQ